MLIITIIQKTLDFHVYKNSYLWNVNIHQDN